VETYPESTKELAVPKSVEGKPYDDAFIAYTEAGTMRSDHYADESTTDKKPYDDAYIAYTEAGTMRSEHYQDEPELLLEAENSEPIDEPQQAEVLTPALESVTPEENLSLDPDQQGILRVNSNTTSQQTAIPNAVPSNIDIVATNSPIKLVMLSQDMDAKDAARDKAEVRLTAEISKANFLGKIWKGSWFKDVYRNKYTREAMKEIKATGNPDIYKKTVEERANDRLAIIDSRKMGLEELVHEGVDTQVEAEPELADGLKNIIRDYCEGKIKNEDDLNEAKLAFLADYREKHGPDSIGGSIAGIDNLFETANAVMGRIEHEDSLDNVLANMQIITGEVRTGTRGEARYNTVDKILEKISSTKIGSLVNPALLATAVTVASSLARIGSHSVVGAVTKTIMPGVASGLWAALRENKMMKDDRAQHSREMAVGGEIKVSDKRREELEKSQYETLSASSMVDLLSEAVSLAESSADSKEKVQKLLDTLLATNTRINMSDERHMDLVSYSSSANMVTERIALDIARANAKVSLNGLLSPGMRQQLGLEEVTPLKEILDNGRFEFEKAIEIDINAKDKIFNKIKAKNIAKSAIVGTLTGIGIGLVFQEGLAAIDPTRSGLLEQLWGGHNVTNGAEHQTLLHGMFNGDHTTVHHDAISHNLINNANGTMSIEDATGHVSADNLSVNSDGSLTQDSIKHLTEMGMVVNDKSFMTEHILTHTNEVNSHDFVQNHINETTHVSRELWYDNNTKAFDQNELRVYWGGDNGITQTGYELDASHMTGDGSFHGAESVDWSEAAKSGDIKLAVSVDSGSQSHVFMIDIDANGKFDIPADSPAGQFFSNEDGHAVFHGAYAEVVQTTGVDTNGVEHIRPLATLVGDKSPGKLISTISETVSEKHISYDIISPASETTRDVFTEVAPIIPIYARKSMESIAERSGKTNYFGGGEYLSSREIELRREETSPRLLDNPESDLVPSEEIAWYRDLLVKKRGRDYVNNLDETIDSIPELNSLSPKVKAFITIPVNAAGKSESENIYNVLSNAYASQDPSSIESSVLLLHANWFDKYTSNDGSDITSEKKIDIEKTLSEIQRAKTDFPELKIAVVETEWKRADIKGGVIGHVCRKMNDVALMAMYKSEKDGNIDGSHDVVIIRNDADPKGVRKNYLKRYIDDFNQNEKTDIFTGMTSFDNSKATRLPGLVFAGNFMQLYNVVSAAREKGIHTAGANFGVRASTLAAVGSLGFGEDTGAGYDDVVTGRRIKAARNGKIQGLGAQKSYNSGYVSYNSGTNGMNIKRNIAMRVNGARIDTDSDRGEDLYEQGIPIIYQWNSEHGFDKGGYRPREDGLKGGTKESLRNGLDVVIDRIRNDMEGTINVNEGGSRYGYEPTALTKSVLAMTFVGLGSEAYTLTPNKSGKLDFNITPKGRDYLKKYLTRDSSGRFDPYGNRKMRWYGQQSKGSKRLPPTQPSMIKV